TVKGPTQVAIEKRIRGLEQAGKRVVVAGCLAQSAPDLPSLQQKPLIGPDSVAQIADAVEASRRGEALRILGRSKTPVPLEVPAVQNPVEQPFVLSISQGCLSSCSFCMTKLARGNLRS